ncbi:hypothetical protein [Emergencia sp. 1XD21-10]|uniref:hypothetical protein n=1 Tax=Emergencia sp. 1XD21-10 TaxID=2304569 RepID=UPI00137B8AF7|nr:hypothetical protein [Emergencia sp. 1XD21-10]NCF00058.1 hypothetical protein [Emergencia sp. 1XD21-10]
MKKNKFLRTNRVIALTLALVMAMTVSVFAAINVSTDNVSLFIGGDNPAAFSPRKTVTVSGTAWTAHMKAGYAGKGVTVKQNRMSSFTITATSSAKVGVYYAEVSQNGEKKDIKITVKNAPY